MELAKEWATPVHVGQLDLRQAFDKIKNTSVINALLVKQVPKQLIAVLGARGSESGLSVRFRCNVVRQTAHGVVCNHGGLRRMLVGLLTRILVRCGCRVWLMRTMFCFFFAKV